jgi:hypothetical protein
MGMLRHVAHVVLVVLLCDVKKNRIVPWLELGLVTSKMQVGFFLSCHFEFVSSQNKNVNSPKMSYEPKKNFETSKLRSPLDMA